MSLAKTTIAKTNKGRYLYNLSAAGDERWLFISALYAVSSNEVIQKHNINAAIHYQLAECFRTENPKRNADPAGKLSGKSVVTIYTVCITQPTL